MPWLAEFASEVFAGECAYEMAVRTLARELLACYECLTDFDPPRLAAGARRVASVFVALEQARPEVWRVKPKLHLFLELCEYVAPARGAPSTFWTYRDEDYGGEAAHMAGRRGGAHTPAAVAKSLLMRFVARGAPPA